MPSVSRSRPAAGVVADLERLRGRRAGQGRSRDRRRADARPRSVLGAAGPTGAGHRGAVATTRTSARQVTRLPRRRAVPVGQLRRGRRHGRRDARAAGRGASRGHRRAAAAPRTAPETGGDPRAKVPAEHQADVRREAGRGPARSIDLRDERGCTPTAGPPAWPVEPCSRPAAASHARGLLARRRARAPTSTLDELSVAAAGRAVRPPRADEVAERRSAPRRRRRRSRRSSTAMPAPPPPDGGAACRRPRRGMARGMDAALRNLFGVVRGRRTPTPWCAGMSVNDGSTRARPGWSTRQRTSAGSSRATCSSRGTPRRTSTSCCPLLGAIVTDRGGQLSHAAIVAREYGIPGDRRHPRRDQRDPGRCPGPRRRHAPARSDAPSAQRDHGASAEARRRGVFGGKAVAARRRRARPGCRCPAGSRSRRTWSSVAVVKRAAPAELAAAARRPGAGSTAGGAVQRRRRGLRRRPASPAPT